MNAKIAWPPVAVRQRLSNHKQLEDAVRATTLDDDLLEQSLTRYLVVRSAGLVESVRDDLADEHARAFGLMRLHSRIVSGLRNGLGARPNQLVTFVGTFDAAWASELDAYFGEEDGRRANDLGALVAARAKVAHGDGETVTAGRALQWSGTARDVAQKLIDMFAF